MSVPLFLRVFFLHLFFFLSLLTLGSANGIPVLRSMKDDFSFIFTKSWNFVFNFILFVCEEGHKFNFLISYFIFCLELSMEILDNRSYSTFEEFIFIFKL